MEKKKKLNLKKVEIAKLSKSRLENIKGGGDSCAFSVVTIITGGGQLQTMGRTCNGYGETPEEAAQNCPTS